VDAIIFVIEVFNLVGLTVGSRCSFCNYCPPRQLTFLKHILEEARNRKYGARWKSFNWIPASTRKGQAAVVNS